MILIIMNETDTTSLEASSSSSSSHHRQHHHHGRHNQRQEKLIDFNSTVVTRRCALGASTDTILAIVVPINTDIINNDMWSV